METPVLHDGDLYQLTICFLSSSFIFGQLGVSGEYHTYLTWRAGAGVRGGIVNLCFAHIWPYGPSSMGSDPGTQEGNRKITFPSL